MQEFITQRGLGLVCRVNGQDVFPSNQLPGSTFPIKKGDEVEILGVNHVGQSVQFDMATFPGFVTRSAVTQPGQTEPIFKFTGQQSIQMFIGCHHQI